MPSAPRSRTAAAAAFAKVVRAVELPRSAACREAPVPLHAKHESVSTTRVWFVWAALMVEVIFALVQPLQPDPVFSSWPLDRQPTLKYATVDRVRQSSVVLLSPISQ